MLTISPASAIASKVFGFVEDCLDERQRRLLLGAFALAAGQGGITQIAGIVGVARRTVRLGLQELTGQRPSPPNGHVRHEGGGRKRLRDDDPELVADLDRLVEPTTRGEPDSPLRWTCRSTEQLAGALREMGHRVSGRTVARLDGDRRQGYGGEGRRFPQPRVLSHSQGTPSSPTRACGSHEWQERRRWTDSWAAARRCGTARRQVVVGRIEVGADAAGPGDDASRSREGPDATPAALVLDRARRDHAARRRNRRVRGRGGQQTEYADGREHHFGDLDPEPDCKPVSGTRPHPHSNRCPDGHPDGHPDPAAGADRGATGGGGTSPDSGARDRLLPAE